MREKMLIGWNRNIGQNNILYSNIALFNMPISKSAHSSICECEKPVFRHAIKSREK